VVEFVINYHQEVLPKRKYFINNSIRNKFTVPALISLIDVVWSDGNRLKLEMVKGLIKTKKLSFQGYLVGSFINEIKCEILFSIS